MFFHQNKRKHIQVLRSAYERDPAPFDIRTYRECDWDVPSFTDHPVTRERGVENVKAVGLYTDKVCLHLQDGFVRGSCGLTWSKEEFTCFIIMVSQLCRCGCNGHCTLDALARQMYWSANCLQNGMNPNSRLGGEPWHMPKDRMRSGRAGSPLPWFCAVNEYRADWPERAMVGGMKSHSGGKPCMSCDAVLGDLHHKYGACSLRSMPWTLRTQERYLLDLNEHLIRVPIANDAIRDLIAENLDWKNGWPWHRCVRTHMSPRLKHYGLKTGDRVSPCYALFSPYEFETVPFHFV